MSAIIPWLGGKRRLAKHIIPLFPEHECYVEPFAGGAALFFMKPEAHVEVLNDINGDLINLYRVVQNHLDEFCKQFRWSLVRKIFDGLHIETLNIKYTVAGGGKAKAATELVIRNF